MQQIKARYKPMDLKALSFFMRYGQYCMLLMVLIASGCGSEPEPVLTERFIDPRSRILLQKGAGALEIHEFDYALAFADSAEFFTPMLPDAAFLRGRIFSELGDFEKAQRAYEQTLSRDAQYRGVWHNIGNNDFRQNQFEEAIQHYKKEINLHEAPIPWRGIGRAYVELGQVDSARFAFDQALQLDSTYAPAHFNLALLLEDEGSFEEALHHALKASTYDAEDWDYRYLMASLLVTNARVEEAIPHLKEVTQTWPWHHASHYKLGQSLLRAGEAEAGEAMIKRSESLRAQDAKILQLLNSARSAHDDPLPHAALGSALRRVGRYEDAMRAYKIARHLDPGNLEVQTNMANLMLIQGDTLSSIRGYQAILQQDPTFTDIWVNLGIVYAMSDLNDEARHAWERALVLEPENGLAKSYLARLGN